jgi:hypothetical protein
MTLVNFVPLQKKITHGVSVSLLGVECIALSQDHDSCIVGMCYSCKGVFRMAPLHNKAAPLQNSIVESLCCRVGVL